MKDFFEILASKRFLKIIKECVSFSIKSFLKYWYLTLISLIVSGYIIWSVKVIQLTDLSYWKVILVLFLSNLPSVFLNYYTSLKFKISDSPFKVAVGELVILEDKEYMTLNTDSQRINRKAYLILNNIIKNKYPYRNGICDLSLLRRPKLFYLTKTLPFLTEYWQNSISDNKVDIILYCTCDTSSNKVEFDIFYSKKEISNEYIPFSEFKDLFDRRFTEKEEMESYIVNVFQFYVGICGQSVLDLIIGFEDFSTGHKVVDDSEVIIKESINNLKRYFESEKTEKFRNFYNVWLCGFERYRSLLLLNQKEYSGALSHLLRSVKFWPYYPYRNYEEFKDSFEKKYMAELNFKGAEVLNLLQDDDAKDNSEKTTITSEMLFNGIDLFDRVENASVPSTEQILKWIMAEANSDSFFLEVERALNKDFCISPIDKIIKSEVFKYLPKGDIKHEELYVKRIPEILAYLREILHEQPDFDVIYLKVGMMMLIQSFQEEDKDKMEILMHEAMSVFKKGLSLYHRMGIFNENT